MSNDGYPRCTSCGGYLDDNQECVNPRHVRWERLVSVVIVLIVAVFVLRDCL